MELPDELRKLVQMRSERQQWAREHYAITEGGLLTRFGPQPSPETRPQEDKEAESHQPASTKPPASVKVCPAPAPADQPVSPQSVNEDLKLTIAAQKDLRSASISTECPGGRTEQLLKPPGRGRLFGQPQSAAAAQSAGRGFLLHMSQAQVSRYFPSA